MAHEEKPLSFGAVVEQVQAVTPLVVLKSKEGEACVAVSPELQARILTSSATGLAGRSYGWVNLPLIASRQPLKHFNPYGGEDRIWLGPEGGQYSVFFAPGTEFDLDHWYVPAPLDTEPFELVEQSTTHVRLKKIFRQQNHAGTYFDLGLDRTVRLLKAEEASQSLTPALLAGVKAVAFESHNVLINTGTSEWTRDKGLLSIWNIGQFNASPSATIVVPIVEGPEEKLGKPINTEYFAPLGEDRLKIMPHVACLKADSQYRCKIGVNPRRVTGRLGSYDAQNNVLTLVEHSTASPEAAYVNAEWRMQDEPYAGDVANCYNDGPAPNGNQLGAFYELESSSPAAELQPGASITHVHRTFHFEGSSEKLNAIAQAVFGLTLEQIAKALPA